MTAPHHLRSDRAAYIMRVGIGRIGVPIGTIVFVWPLVDGYRTNFEGLQTETGWRRLLGTAILCVVEWLFGVGWMIGAALRHGQDVVRRDRRRKP